MINQEEIFQITHIIDVQLDKMIKLSSNELINFHPAEHDPECSIEYLCQKLLQCNIENLEIKRKILYLIKKNKI